MSKNSTYKRYVWTSIWLGAGTLIGIVLVLWFSIKDDLSTGLLMLWSMAYLAIGGLLGFIFSVPKMISDTGATPAPVTVAGTALTPEATAAVNAKLAASQKRRYEENTNLTQISDWLTKILIGATLVQLKEIPPFVLHVARVMGNGVILSKAAANAANGLTIICAAIILYFVTWGFISGYLVMKLVLTEQFANTDTDDGQ